MPEVTINYPAILLCGIVSMIIGFIWYGPLFGKPWMKMVGISKETIEKSKSQMPVMYGTSFLLSLIAAYVLSYFIDYIQATNAITGAITGFWLWLGFVFTTLVVNGLYEGRRKKLMAINAGYQLTQLVIMGMILAVWV